MGKLANDRAQGSPELPADGGKWPTRAVPGLTVRKAMEIPALTGARLLAGENGLDRVVQRANIMEVPDLSLIHI